MMRPNLFIVGAPKCGTTALASWLAQHPEVFVSRAKEPHHFSDDHPLTPRREDYEALFVDADPATQRWACEASVWYLHSDSAVPNILGYAPDARFVVMVRNPIDMAAAMHQHHCFNGNELIPDFEQALAHEEARRAGAAAGVRAGYRPPEHMAYLRSCATGWQVQRLLQRVPRERVHVVVYDDLAADPRKVWEDVLAFLALPPHAPASFGKVNASKRRRMPWLDRLTLKVVDAKRRLGFDRRLGLLSRLRRWNVRRHERVPMPEALRRRLAAAFADDVALLGSLLDRDLSRWLENSER